MPYLQKFESDIFVSYSNANNAETLDGQKWVDRFVERLHNTLENLMGPGGKALRIYVAEKGDLPYGDQIERCCADARRSAIFLIIGSPLYLDDWPTRELTAFAETPQFRDRLFVAEMRPLDPPGYQEVIGDPNRALFWTRTDRGKPLPFQTSGGEFLERLNDLAGDMRDKLLILHKAENQDVPFPAPDPNYRTVLLARTTRDLNPLRAQLATYLRQAGIRVLPDKDFADDHEVFAGEFDACLAQSNIVVQLLGLQAAARSERLPEGYDGYQAAKTLGATEVALMQWRSRNVAVDTIDDSRHKALLSLVKARDFEEFKGCVKKEASTPRRPPPPDGFLLIDAADDDLTQVQIVLAECGRRRRDAQFPDGLDLGDWLELYEDADRIAIISGNTDAKWVKQRVSLFMRTKKNASATRDGLVFLGPPKKNSAQQINAVSRSLKFIEAHDGNLNRLFEELF